MFDYPEPRHVALNRSQIRAIQKGLNMSGADRWEIRIHSPENGQLLWLHSDVPLVELSKPAETNDSIFGRFFKKTKPSSAFSAESLMEQVSYYGINLVPFFGDQELRTISVKQVQSYKAIRSGKLNPKTINNHLGVLSSALEDAIKWHFTDRNPVRSVKKCQLETTADDYNYLNAEEAKRFLEVAETIRPRWVPLYGLALNTGLRQGELAALKWQDIDFNKRQLTVIRSITDGVESTPKSKKARTVPLNKKAIRYLERQRKQTGAMEYVFISDKGLRVDSNRIKTAFGFCREAVGVKVCFHDLRHSFASHMVSRGASLYKVQKAIGHKSASTTQRYAHLQQSDLHDAVALLDD